MPHRKIARNFRCFGPARPVRHAAFTLLAAMTFGAAPIAAQTLGQAFAKSVAVAVQEDGQENEIVADFYKSRAYAPLWTDGSGSARLAALMGALDAAAAHGLPTQRYDGHALRAAAQLARSEGDMGRLEVALTKAFLSYGRDLSSGALEPIKVDGGILREIIRPDPALMLAAMAATSDPAAYLHGLAPKSPAYTKLMAEKAALEARAAQGAFAGPIPARKLAEGAKGDGVIALRNRLIELGYMPQSAQAVYDGAMTRAVQRFQREQGLNADGVAGETTIDLLNAAPEARLASVVVALERLRWMGNTPLGARHIWVNQPDFTAKVVDDGAVTFRTRVVIGKNVPDQRSPEFSDEMEYMAINPSWGVPRSIIVKEYLPLLQRNPNAVGHLQVVDGKGRVVPRGAVNFAGYSAKSFPFSLRQPPSAGNALGIVKFMFPNANNIYLHDTPSKNLFDHEVRAYSHGCIRVGDPKDLAYALLARQSGDPQAAFKAALDTGNETNIPLEQKIPVHLVYFTAFPDAGGEVRYRADVYGRDAKLFDALIEAGLEMPAKSG
ncbi:MAG: L,D-transpeptidase family protein [Cypionkella sp.]|nr:L,D-transpeptidase family protein [Cypionkella sp.]